MSENQTAECQHKWVVSADRVAKCCPLCGDFQLLTPTRYLTLAEQHILHGAQRRSVRIVSNGQ
jgi:hypothetical protein